MVKNLKVMVMIQVLLNRKKAWQMQSQKNVLDQEYYERNGLVLRTLPNLENEVYVLSVRTKIAEAKAFHIFG